MNRSELLSELRRLAQLAMPDDGYDFGRLPGVAFTRASAPQKAHQCFYRNAAEYPMRKRGDG